MTPQIPVLDKWVQQSRDRFSQSSLPTDTQTNAKFVSAYKKIASRIAIEPNARILDVGCGHGHISRALNHVTAYVVGFDVTRAQLNVAAHHNPNGLFVEADMISLPYCGSAFDCVVSITSMEFCEDKKRAFREIRRVLKDAGKFYMEVRNRNFALLKWIPQFLISFLRAFRLASSYKSSEFWDRSYEEWSSSLKSTGFRIIAELPSIRPWNYGSMLTRFKNAIIQGVKFIAPLRFHYMIAFLCVKDTQSPNRLNHSEA